MTMTIPAWIFSAMLYFAVFAVAVGAAYLLIVLVADWRNRRLW